MEANEALLMVTYAGQLGELPDPVPLDATDGDIRAWVSEALRAGSIPGLAAQPDADMRDFVIDRFSPTEARPHSVISVRPKTPFGG